VKLLVLPTSTSNFTYLSLLVVPAMAAALMGLLRSFTAAALGGIVVGIVESLGLSSSAFSQYTEVLPFFFIVALMIWWKRKDVWAETR
jgi:branched-chain amino acid transport system permease protein